MVWLVAVKKKFRLPHILTNFSCRYADVFPDFASVKKKQHSYVCDVNVLITSVNCLDLLGKRKIVLFHKIPLIASPDCAALNTLLDEENKSF